MSLPARTPPRPLLPRSELLGGGAVGRRGNAGKAVSYLSQQSGIDAKVFMPDTAPDDRKEMMERLGATVTKVPGEGLLDAVAACIEAERRILVHPFDDMELIRGHASCGLEILEE